MRWQVFFENPLFKPLHSSIKTRTFNLCKLIIDNYKKLDSFYKKITFQQLTKQGLKNIASTVTAMAEAEGLQAHANAVAVRLEKFD